MPADSSSVDVIKLGDKIGGGLYGEIFKAWEIDPECIRRGKDLEEMGPDHALHNLVSQCLVTAPEDRPSAAEIIGTTRKFSATVEGKSSGCFLSSSLV